MSTRRPPWLAAGFFIAAGIAHFALPRPYLAMMPPYLPHPRFLVAASGVAEIAGGVGLLPRVSRPLAGWGLIALLLAVFPANLQIALHGWPGYAVPAWVLWARLPLQAVFLGWVYRVSLAKPAPDPRVPSHGGV